MDEVVAGVARHLESGQQAYWVCPMVRDHESEDIAAAEEVSEGEVRLRLQLEDAAKERANHASMR